MQKIEAQCRTGTGGEEEVWSCGAVRPLCGAQRRRLLLGADPRASSCSPASCCLFIFIFIFILFVCKTKKTAFGPTIL
jgi:hypothetical protein